MHLLALGMASDFSDSLGLSAGGFVSSCFRRCPARLLRRRKSCDVARDPRGRYFNYGLVPLVKRSISAISSVVSFHSMARALSSTCSGLVAPAMMLETGGRAASQL